MDTLDPSNMHDMIAGYPNQFGRGFDLTYLINIRKPVDKVILTGMGGSAIMGDIINCAFEGIIRQPILISRNYTIPYPMDEKTLVIANSFSGNTEETISAYEQARATGAQVVAVASGGRLLELADKDGVQRVKVIKESANSQPRMSSGYIFAIITSLLMKIDWLPFSYEQAVRKMAQTLLTMNTEGQGRQLGESLFDTVPILYTSDSYWPVARVGKIKLNENSKIPAFWNYLPEVNHTEMVGFTNANANYRIVMLRDPDDDPRIHQRMEVMADILRSQGIGLKATIWDMIGHTRLEKIFSTLMIMDWASYYLALKMGIDPTPVKLVEDFKLMMK